MDLKEIDILGSDIDKHWYYISKARAMMQLLKGFIPSKILDVGAGSGFFSRFLLKNSSADEAWCVDISYDTDSDVLEGDKKIHFKRSIDSVQANIVLLMDVLEHVDDDIALLKQYKQKVLPNTFFLISVPAFQFLWSGHDEFLHHKRRYTLRGINSVVSNSGLKVRKCNYYFGVIFPIAATIRLSQKLIFGIKNQKSELTRHHPIINSLLKAVCCSELYFMRLNRFAGLTAFCLAEKTDL